VIVYDGLVVLLLASCIYTLQSERVALARGGWALGGRFKADLVWLSGRDGRVEFERREFTLITTCAFPFFHGR
jgi:hypothetical protein